MVANVKIVAALCIWTGLSGELVLTNAALLKSFMHPIKLVCWNMLVSSASVMVFRLTRPKLFATGNDTIGSAPRSFRTSLRIGVPVAVAQVAAPFLETCFTFL